MLLLRTTISRRRVAASQFLPVSPSPRLPVSMSASILSLLAILALSCAPGKNTTGFEALETRVVRFPNGKEVRAEIKLYAADMARGMMFRDSFAPGTGMLFIHVKPDRHTYWMYQVKVPLDIIWMDSSHRIVEISPDTPPCKTKASECPTYGGKVEARYVLELPAGEVQRQGLRLGDNLTF
jgi:uncharacterized membrane protein (UPF0127 family)